MRGSVRRSVTRDLAVGIALLMGLTLTGRGLGAATAMGSGAGSNPHPITEPDETEVAATLQTAEVKSGRTILHTTVFGGTSLPEGWVEQGGWRVNNGLQTPAQGSFSCYAIWSKETGIDQTLLEGRIQLVQTNTQLALARRDISRDQTGAFVAGSLGMLDGVANKLVLYGAWDGTNQPGVEATADIPFPLVAGREYLLDLWKTDAGHHYLALFDTVTWESAEVSVVRTPFNDPGKQLDAPGFLFVSGAARIIGMTFSTPCPPRPQLIIYGDSITEGEVLKPNYDARYSKLLADALGGSCLIAVRGRESTFSVLNRLEVDLDSFAPKYTLILLGINDASPLDWIKNVQTFVQRCGARGAIPVLGTLLPCDLRRSYIDYLNQWIRQSGVRYVDLAKAVSVNHDGVHWVPDMLWPDGIHPNPKGNQAMFEQCRLDAPYLFPFRSTPTPLDLRVIPASTPGLAVRTASWESWPGRPYRVESSSDLLHWEVLTNVTATSIYTFLPGPAPNSVLDNRFYRLR